MTVKPGLRNTGVGRFENHGLSGGFSPRTDNALRTGEAGTSSSLERLAEKSAQNDRSTARCPALSQGASRPISRVLSWTTIPLGPLSPAASSDLPGSPRGDGAFLRRLLPYLVLLRVGFSVPRSVTTRAVRSYRTFSPLPGPEGP